MLIAAAPTTLGSSIENGVIPVGHYPREAQLNKKDITGVVLAGGQGRRMGGLDKGLVPFGARPLVEWVIDALAPQVGGLLISANRHLDQYRGYGFPVVTDSLPGYQGPLAGIASAMATVDTPWMLVVPCDGPWLAPDLAARLAAAQAATAAEIAVASADGHMHPTHALISVHLEASLDRFLESGERKLRSWYALHRLAIADLSDRARSFANINTLDESIRADST